MRQLEVVIVGAGVAGLTTAVGLTAAGHRVRVLERGAEVSSEGAALGLWPAAQLGLERLGVLPLLEDDPVPYRRGLLRDRRGRHLGELPLDRIERSTGRPVVMVGRPVLMRALVERAERAGVPAVELEARASVTELLDAGADLVVGADGIRSGARRYVVPSARSPRDAHATAWRGSCEGRFGPEGEIWGAGMFAGVTAGGTTVTNWYVAVHDRQEVTSFDDLRRRVLHWPDPLPEVLARTKPDDVLRHPIQDLPPVPTYVRGRVALVGDAAHAMTPSLGQGACQAVLDAVALVDALGDQPDVKTALWHYDDERRRTATRFVRGSRALTRVQLSRALPEAARNALVRVTGPLAR
jgi:2-polyprenyl-6-methoxyphenol hydroxylase-like FAD-dependent oxidoreductase